MDIMPASRNYQISASGEYFSLDEYVLLAKDENIQPFFVFPPKDDPDIATVTVTFSPVYSDDADTYLVLDYQDGLLHPFTMPDINMGTYLMAFQVYGKNNFLLSKTEKCVFYLGDKNYEITDITVCLPAFSVPSHLIPPGITVLLEAGIAAGPDLDPYIFWYNGKSRIGEGRIADGAGRILWDVPSTPGFQNIRAEVIPFPPMQIDEPSPVISRTGKIHLGKFRELLLPISARGQLRSALSGFLDSISGINPKNIYCDFRFAGNMCDFLNPENIFPGQPRWCPVKSVYGLQIGPDDIHQFPFVFYDEKISFIFRFSPLDEGDYFIFSYSSDDNTGDTESQIIVARHEDSFAAIFRINETEEIFPLDFELIGDFQTFIISFIPVDEENIFSVMGYGNNVPLLEKFCGARQPAGSNGLLQFGGIDSGAGSGAASSGVNPVMVLAEAAMAVFNDKIIFMPREPDVFEENSESPDS